MKSAKMNYDNDKASAVVCRHVCRPGGEVCPHRRVHQATVDANGQSCHGECQFVGERTYCIRVVGVK
jgi:hypothetical protein